MEKFQAYNDQSIQDILADRGLSQAEIKEKLLFWNKAKVISGILACVPGLLLIGMIFTS